MAKLFHRPISQEKWCQRALKHVFVAYGADNIGILGVIKLLYPMVNQPIEYKRKLLKGLSFQKLD